MLSVFPGQRYKYHGHDLTGADSAPFIFGYQDEMLHMEKAFDGNDHFSARFQLFNKRRRDITCRCCDDDRIIGRMF